jgi:glutaredoxin
VRCARHPIAGGPDGRCPLCIREATTKRAVGGALLGLVAATTLLVVAAVAYRLGGAVTAMKALAPDMRLAATHAVVPPEEAAPGTARDPLPEGGLREFEEAFAKAWHAGQESASETETEDEPIREAATTAATGDTRTAIASATADADPLPTTTMGTEIADPPAATATATPNLLAAVTTATNAPAAPAPTTSAPPTPTTSATPAPAASVDAPIASATVPAVLAVPPTTPTIVGDAGPSDLHVIVYTASWCDVCKRAEAWMVRYRIPYEERDITASGEYWQELRQISPGLEVPTFDVDGDVMVGFNARQLLVTMKQAALKRAAAAAL